MNTGKKVQLNVDGDEFDVTMKLLTPSGGVYIDETYFKKIHLSSFNFVNDQSVSASVICKTIRLDVAGVSVVLNVSFHSHLKPVDGGVESNYSIKFELGKVIRTTLPETISEETKREKEEILYKIVKHIKQIVSSTHGELLTSRSDDDVEVVVH